MTKKPIADTNPKPKPGRCPACGQLITLDEHRIDAILDQLPPRAFIRAKLLLQLLPFSEATLWRKVAANKFPKPVKLSERITGWRVEEVRQWMIDHHLLR
jgi:prophage regulatory protein